MPMKGRGKCAVCNRDSSVKRDGTVQMHWEPDPERPGFSKPCAGAGKAPAAA